MRLCDARNDSAVTQKTSNTNQDCQPKLLKANAGPKAIQRMPKQNLLSTGKILIQDCTTNGKACRQYNVKKCHTKFITSFLPNLQLIPNDPQRISTC